MISLHYESRFGLGRGAVFVDGRPFLYAEGPENDPGLCVLGTRSVARIGGCGGGVTFVTLADGSDAILDAPQGVSGLNEGVAAEVEITAEARRGKLAVARWAGPGSGEPRRVSPVVTLRERLIARARKSIGGEITEVETDPDLIDAACDEAMNPSAPLPGGGYLPIERTRALIACDVDAAGATGRDAARRCNEEAVAETARRLRLSGLAGLVVVDLIGRKHNAERLCDLLVSAFAPETVIVAPIGRFGTLEFVRPWGACPAMDVPVAVRASGLLLRKAAREAAHRPGRVLTLRATPDVLDMIRPLLKGSLDPLSALIRLESAQACEVIVS